MNSAPKDARVLEDLFQVIEDRRTADPAVSNTAKLFARGRAKICQKLGEEAVETVVAGLHETPERVAAESADLLYHLLVLWVHAGVRPAMVWGELQKREGVSGIQEKNSRPKE